MEVLDFEFLRKVLPLECQIDSQRTKCPANGHFFLSSGGLTVCSVHHPKACSNKLNLKLCQQNMLSIRMAIEAFKNKSSSSDFWDGPCAGRELIRQGVMKKIPKCPSGGHYNCNLATEIVECDTHGELKLIAEEYK